MSDWREVLMQLSDVGPSPELGRRILSDAAVHGPHGPSRTRRTTRQITAWLLAGAGVVVVVAALALAAHSRQEKPPPATSPTPTVIHDGHTQINGGTPAQRTLLASLLLGISSKDVPEVTVALNGPPDMKAGTWLVFHFPGSDATDALGAWQSALVAGAFHDRSQALGLPLVAGYGQLFHPDTGSNYGDFSPAARHDAISPVSAKTLTERIRRNARREGITLVSIRFARTIGLAPIVIARTDDPTAKLGSWRPSAFPIGDDSHLEGSFFEVVNAAGKRVFYLGHATRAQHGAESCCGRGIQPAEVVVPNVEPGYVQDAEQAIKAAGLRVVIRSVPLISDADASVNGYAIAGQTPAAGLRVPLGTQVVLMLAVSVNGGPGGVGRPGVVPELVGMPVNRAISVAASVGLHVTVPAVQHDVSSDAVTSQSLPPGSPVFPDAVITLTLG
jgi:hypothetical protein